MPCVEAGAVYEHKYLLGTSMARPVIAKKLVEIARKEGGCCHLSRRYWQGQTTRFVLNWASKLWPRTSRSSLPGACRSFGRWTPERQRWNTAGAHGIDLPFAADSSYSRDRNLWHISHEGLELEDPANEPNYDHMLVLSVTPEKAPDKETEISMTFGKRCPQDSEWKSHEGIRYHPGTEPAGRRKRHRYY